MKPSASLAERIAKVVVIEPEWELVTVRLVLGRDAPLGLKVHVGAWRAATRLLMRRSGGQPSADKLACRFLPAQRPQAEDLVFALRAALMSIARRPLSPGQVEAVLGISPEQRRRLCEEGRLVRSGQATIAAGRRSISIWTYSVAGIESLAQEAAAG